MRFLKLYLGQGFFEILLAAQASPLDAKQSQEANVPTRNSSLNRQFREIRKQESSVPPKANQGSAAIYHSGSTGV